MSWKRLYVDNHLLVVNKPPGLPVVPDSSKDPSLLEEAKQWIKREYDKPGRVFLGVVHRLDRPVSGVVVFARTSKAAARLSDQWRRRAVRKFYWGLTTAGPHPPGDDGFIEQWLLKDPERNRARVLSAHEIRRAKAIGAKQARTRWRVLERLDIGTLLELEPLTGRPHQLRLATASLGAPLSGDLKYGAERAWPDRSIALHARELRLEHPTTKQELRFTAPLLGHFQQLLSGAGWNETTPPEDR